MQLRIAVDDQATAGGSSRNLRRAYISPDALRTHKFVAGEWVRVVSVSAELVVQLWPRVGVADDDLVLDPAQLTNIPLGLANIKRFEPTRDVKGIARAVALNGETPSGREAVWLEAVVKEALMSIKYIHEKTCVQVCGKAYSLDSIEISDKRRTGNGIEAVSEDLQKLKLANGNSTAFYEMDWRTTVKVVTAKDTKKTTTPPKPMPSYINLFTPSSSQGYERLGGLGSQIAQVRTMLELPMSRPEMFASFGLTPPRGILLHGPPGTGKTALARAVAADSGCSCIVVNGPELSSAYHGESEERLRGVFDEARSRKPCIVVLDEADALCPRRDADGGEVEKRVVATLLTLMDGMSGGEGVFVIAATNRPNSVDPALRRPGRFDREIEIGIPTAAGREEIISILVSKMPHSLSGPDISALAGRTHGFVGADLSSLVREAAVAAIQRCSLAGSDPCLTLSDIHAVLPGIRPSTMREVFIETPKVKWSDIGGQANVKQKLRECVEWPLKHRDTFLRLGVEAPRGVLLYGPPGCSKTLTARALASESGLNFIAVKGPELLNKYVGESERAVREIFRKARAASPSIIFFASPTCFPTFCFLELTRKDEIDALGSARSDDASHNGVLTSLLNEMDGIEEMTGVTVVAATNRPDVLDGALMRPGRLDRILYVGAPDLATRTDIFRIRFQSMAIEPGVNIDELAQITEGCSGAEIASICQDAALMAMNEDLNAPYVGKTHLLHSARTVRRRITPDMLRFFGNWRDQSGVRSA